MKNTSKKDGETCTDFPLEETSYNHGGTLSAHCQCQYPLCILQGLVSVNGLTQLSVPGFRADIIRYFLKYLKLN